MIKVLFLIHDLGVGGAEKVLVNLVNNLDQTRFSVTVVVLFGGGVNEQYLSPEVAFRAVWPRPVPGNSKLLKLLSPRRLHTLCVKGDYDVEVAYLEGPSARVVSGCENPRTKLVGWIHIEQHTHKCAAGSFRSFRESVDCYRRFNQIVAVSQTVREDFLSIYPGMGDVAVCYNTIETDKILALKDEPVDDVAFCVDEIKLVAVGKISKRKGFDRLARILKRLRSEGLPTHLYALGVGSDQDEIERYLRQNGLWDYYTFLGYQTNPYKYMARCDLFVCASLAEGFSTAATEALVLGVPVCTVQVSGMREMLGANNEWGVVTENDDEALYQGIHDLVTNPSKLAHYRKAAFNRGESFSKANTVKAVEELLKRV